MSRRTEKVNWISFYDTKSTKLIEIYLKDLQSELFSLSEFPDRN